MNLYAYFKKYVWDENKTPYLVPVARLNRTQAKNELFACAVLLAMFTLVIAVAALLGKALHGPSPGVAFYASTVCCSAIALSATRHYLAALYCSAAPLAALLYFFFYGFPPNLHLMDELLILTLMLALLRYGMRVTAIARAYRGIALNDQTE